jgi:uncharacterized protein YigE (DUF2233 family)
MFRERLFALGVTVLILTGCNLPGRSDLIPTRTPLPVAVATLTASPGPAPTDISHWEDVAPGVQLQIAQLPINHNVGSADIVLLRADQSQVRLQMFYAPDDPATVVGWQARTKAIATINGGFFLPNNVTDGLLVSNGNRYGVAFDHFGGMLSVANDKISLRSLAQFPYDPSETLEQAVQGRPMVLYPGGFPVQFDDIANTSDRRTVVAQDRSGRLVFVVAQQSVVSLYRLRDWLANERPDLDLFVAFNLDGGHSTGLVIPQGSHPLSIDSRTRIPAVIALFERK